MFISSKALHFLPCKIHTISVHSWKWREGCLRERCLRERFLRERCLREVCLMNTRCVDKYVTQMSQLSVLISHKPSLGICRPRHLVIVLATVWEVQYFEWPLPFWMYLLRKGAYRDISHIFLKHTQSTSWYQKYLHRRKGGWGGGGGGGLWHYKCVQILVVSGVSLKFACLE